LAEAGLAEPRFSPLKTPPGIEPAPRMLAFGAEFRRWREAGR
jgi:hypothetical protein